MIINKIDNGFKNIKMIMEHLHTDVAKLHIHYAG